MKTTKVFAVVVLALVLSTNFESVAEARRVHPNHHHNKLSKKHQELEQPVVLATIASVIGIVGGVITIADKIYRIAEGGGCLGPRRDRSDDEDYEEQPGDVCSTTSKEELRKELIILRSLVSKVDLSKPVLFRDGKYYVHVTSDDIEGDLMSAREAAAPTKFKLTPTASISKTVPSDMKKAVKSFKRMDSSEMLKKVGSDMEEELIFVTIAGVVGLVSGAITITDAIIRATRRTGRRDGSGGGGRRSSGGSGGGGTRKGKLEEEEAGGSSEDLPTYVFDSESFWGEVSKVTDPAAVEKQRAQEVRALLRTMVDGLANIDPDSIDVRDGEWTVPIKMPRSG